MHYKGNSHDQSEQVVDVVNFTGTYTLDNLTPYTEYSVYVTAVRLIGDTGRLLEGSKSITITQRTLAGSKSKEIFLLVKLIKSYTGIIILSRVMAEVFISLQ